jgi:hypothetical protein
MTTKELEDNAVEWAKKSLGAHIKMCNVLLEELDVPEGDYRNCAQYCALIILQHVDRAIKHLNSGVVHAESPNMH